MTIIKHSNEMNSEQVNLVKEIQDGVIVSKSDKTRISECLLDFLASVLLGTKLNIGKKIVKNYINDCPRNFAFTLAYLAELTEYSHGHHREAGHVGSTTLPVALALARRNKHQNIDFTQASIVGYEAVCRFGESIMPDLKKKWGANATGFTGSIGAAAVAAKVYQLSTEEMVTAIGTAAYLTPFNPQEGYTTGVHGFETGVAVSNGIMATQLSKQLHAAEIEGANNILDVYYKRLKGKEVPFGFLTSDEKTSAIDELYFKPYPSCRATHGVIEATEKLLKQDFKLEDIEKVQILTSPSAANLTAKIPSKNKLGYIDRQFSMQYLTAAILHGYEIEEVVFGASDITDEELIDFAKQKISVAVKDTLGDSDERFGSIVQAWLKNGDVKVSNVPFPFGSLQSPMSLEDLILKFDKTTLNTIGSEGELWKEDILQLNWTSLSNRIHNHLLKGE